MHQEIYTHNSGIATLLTFVHCPFPLVFLCSNFSHIYIMLSFHVQPTHAGAWYYGFEIYLPWYFSELAMNYPAKRSKTFDEEYAGCNTQKVTKRSMRQSWLRNVGLQINTKTNRSRAGEFRKFVLRCSVLVPNSWMWTSDYTIVRCFCISQHPQHAFSPDEAPLLLWQSI